MRKIVFLSLMCIFALFSCTPNRWYLVNSDGVLTYNRHTGQLEVLWEHHEKPNPVATGSDSLKVDSLKN